MRIINKLSAKTVRSIAEPGIYGDGAGLYLQVRSVRESRLAKSWLFRYSLNGRARYMGLGSIQTFTLPGSTGSGASLPAKTSRRY